MGQSRKDVWIGHVATRGALVIYFLVLSAGISRGYESFVLPACGIALVYVAIHIFENIVRGHWGVSADSTAFPVTLLVAAVVATVAHYHYAISSRELMMSAIYGLAAVGAAHVAAYGWAFLSNWVLDRCFRW